MNVFLIASWYPTPKNPLIVPFISGQARALAEFGHKVTVISAEVVSLRSGEKPGLRIEEENGVTVYQYILPIYRFGKDGFTAALTGMLVKKLFCKAAKKQGIPDIVHIHSFRFAGVEGANMAKKYHAPCLLTEHYSAIMQGKLSGLDQGMLRKTLHSADRVISVSPALQERIHADFGIESVFIPNFVDENNFYPKPGKHNIFTFVTCCWLSRRKAVDVLLRAFAQTEGCLLKVAGEGPELENLKKLAGELGINDRVEFTGSKTQAELAKLYNICDCFVLPSRAETFGVVYIEAMACGLPVIASRCGGPETIVDGSNGALVDIEDVQGLAEVMTEIKNGKKVFYSGEINRKCIEKYGKMHIVQKITEIYNGICSGK